MLSLNRQLSQDSFQLMMDKAISQFITRLKNKQYDYSILEKYEQETPIPKRSKMEKENRKPPKKRSKAVVKYILCEICYENQKSNQFHWYPCSHKMCLTCYDKWSQKPCPICRSEE